MYGVVVTLENRTRSHVSAESVSNVGDGDGEVTNGRIWKQQTGQQALSCSVLC